MMNQSKLLTIEMTISVEVINTPYVSKTYQEMLAICGLPRNNIQRPFSSIDLIQCAIKNGRA